MGATNDRRAAAPRIFGTDGVRGRAGEDWLAPERTAILGRTLAEVVVAAGGPRPSGANAGRCLVAHDGRRSGPELEAALGRGLVAGGFGVTSAGLITTPALALLTRMQGFELGAMVSASHNPATDNGIKVFNASGEKLSDELERTIEAALVGPLAPVEAGPPPQVDPELERTYLAHMTETVGAGLRLDGLGIVVDCANGAGSRVAPRVFGRLGARITAIAADPDGDNINRDCGSTHPALLQSEVRKQQAQVGVALDGDGDRCVLVDEHGQLVHGDGILTVLARHAMERRAFPDPRIVATVMSNRGLHRAMREVGVSVVTVDVGDRHVVEALRRDGLKLGGEQSGHIVFGADNFFIGDGLYTALRVLAVMRETERPLSELAAPYRPFPQVLVNVPVARKPSLADVPAVIEYVRKIEQEFGEDGRVLLRYSGTEPLARVMVEGPDPARIQELARGLAELVAPELAR
jgi:phosphoglucosamine mutase